MIRLLSILIWPYDHLKNIWIGVVVTVAAVLAGVLWPPSVAPVLPDEVLSPREISSAGSAGLASEDTLDFIDRPLFSATRRRPKTPDLSASAEADPPPNEAELLELEGVQLVGTFGSGEHGGIIITLADGERARLSMGEKVKGWKLAEVKPREAHFQNAAGSEAVLSLALASNLPMLKTEPSSRPLSSQGTNASNGDVSREGDLDVVEQEAGAQKAEHRGAITFDSIEQEQRERMDTRKREEASREG